MSVLALSVSPNVIGRTIRYLVITSDHSLTNFQENNCRAFVISIEFCTHVIAYLWSEFYDIFVFCKLLLLGKM